MLGVITVVFEEYNPKCHVAKLSHFVCKIPDFYFTVSNQFASKVFFFHSLPRQLCRNLLIADKSARVVRSPRLAAMGVATLSGLTLHFLENTTTAAMTEPRMRLASVAVTKLLAQRSVAW